MASRNRTGKACYPCKIRKSKCSDFRPCARCSQTKPEMCWEASGLLDANIHGATCFRADSATGTGNNTTTSFDATVFDEACAAAVSSTGDAEKKNYSADLKYRDSENFTDRIQPLSIDPFGNYVTTRVTAADSTTLMGSDSFSTQSHHSDFSMTDHADTFLIKEYMHSKQILMSAPEIEASAGILQNTSRRFRSIDSASDPAEQPSNDGDGAAEPWVWEAPAGPGRNDPFKEDWAAWAEPTQLFKSRPVQQRSWRTLSTAHSGSEKTLISEVDVSAHAK